ncbi:hypothetical protein BJ508DRAFT_333150 [Ascobolus immersus RN42]|uniref:Uncharacterized protein n=1 Tax=Ascobolus immersus RN42 TaxID=1160509 RepID=A0A3N4HM98_ASCIM|nr:hypothetical protein BJ508DRAFT_333150 [Ascobolus immersus RN42]
MSEASDKSASQHDMHSLRSYESDTDSDQFIGCMQWKFENKLDFFRFKRDLIARKMNETELETEWASYSTEFQNTVLAKIRNGWWVYPEQEKALVRIKLYTALDIEEERIRAIGERIWMEGPPSCWECGRMRHESPNSDWWKERKCRPCLEEEEVLEQAKNGYWNCVRCGCIPDIEYGCNCSD